MTAKLGFMQMRIRTQSSQDFSLGSNDLINFQHSFESIQLSDNSISNFIQHLAEKQHQPEQKQTQNYTSRSLSYILVKENDIELRKKYSSMKSNKKTKFTLQIVQQHIMSQLIAYHRCLNLAKHDVSNRVYGAMFGFLIGDALGAHVANLTVNQNKINEALLMNGGGVMNLKSGQGTDQWEICLALSQGLIQCNGVYNPSIIARKYLQWLDSDPIDLPVLFGIAYSDIKKQRNKTGKINESTIGHQLAQDSLRNIKQQSNLGLIRLIPLVIWGLDLQEYKFSHLIRQQMKLITPNDFVQETALVFANLLRLILLTGDHIHAYHQTSHVVDNFGSQKMIDLWRSIEDKWEPIMTTGTAKNLKFPFIFAINQILEIEKKENDLKKQFIQSAVRILFKGFNTDTNCSITLSLVGAVIGYNNIPSFFRNKIINSDTVPSKTARKRFYHSKRVVEITQLLLTQRAHETEEYDF